MSVREAQAKIDAPEFRDWQAYDELSPIGPEREDLRAASICHTIAMFLTDGEAPPIGDFLLRFERSKAAAAAATPPKKRGMPSASQLKMALELAGVQVIDKRKPKDGGNGRNTSGAPGRTD